MESPNHKEPVLYGFYLIFRQMEVALNVENISFLEWASLNKPVRKYSKRLGISYIMKSLQDIKYYLICEVSSYSKISSESSLSIHHPHFLFLSSLITSKIVSSVSPLNVSPTVLF